MFLCLANLSFWTVNISYMFCELWIVTVCVEDSMSNMQWFKSRFRSVHSECWFYLDLEHVSTMYEHKLGGPNVHHFHWKQNRSDPGQVTINIIHINLPCQVAVRKIKQEEYIMGLNLNGKSLKKPRSLCSNMELCTNLLIKIEGQTTYAVTIMVDSWQVSLYQTPLWPMRDCMRLETWWKFLAARLPWGTPVYMKESWKICPVHPTDLKIHCSMATHPFLPMK